jgi:hypothetical protein
MAGVAYRSRCYTTSALLRVLGRHILVAGVSDAGKSSVIWAGVARVGPWIRCGVLQEVFA